LNEAFIRKGIGTFKIGLVRERKPEMERNSIIKPKPRMVRRKKKDNEKDEDWGMGLDR
jgi:hypothetical protein